MSRTGKKPIKIPEKVKIKHENGVVFVEGPLGKHQVEIHPLVKVELNNDEVQLIRENDTREAKQYHGLYRSLIQNHVTGVASGFEKNLLIEGVGYRAELKGNDINLSLGFSHPVVYSLPQGVSAKVDKQTKILLNSSDKALLGQVAADIRSIRPPEPYKGKGVRYENEHVQRKVGKAAGK